MGSSHWNTSYQKLIEMEFNVALFFRTAPGNVHIAFISFLPFQMNLTGKFSSVIFHVLDTLLSAQEFISKLQRKLWSVLFFLKKK